MKRLCLYSTEGCHLCEEAEQLLGQAMRRTRGQFEFMQSDIAQAEDLLRQYGTRIPVLKCLEGGAELDWPFTLPELENFLAHL